MRLRTSTAALLYALVTAALFRNLLPDVATHLYSDLGDPLLNATILAWNAGHAPLSAAWWNFPGFAPLTGVTSFTEHLLLAYPVASPVIWLTGNPVLAYNIVFLLAMPLNAIAAFVLARELTGSPAAAWVAGLAFAFSPYQSVHLSHLQHMLLFGMPVALFWLHRYLRTGRWTTLVGFAAGWLAAVLASSALLVFFPVLVGLWVVWFIRPREWRRGVGVAAAAGAASLPLVPLLWGYTVHQAANGLTRTYDEIRAFSADVVGLGGMYHRATAWRSVLPHDFEEGALFPGAATLGLAVIAVAGAVGARPPGADAVRSFAPWPRRLLTAFVVITTIVLARVWTGPWGWHLGPVPLPPFRPYTLCTIAVVVLAAAAVLTVGVRRGWVLRNAALFYGVAAVVLWLLALGPEPEWTTPWRALLVGPYRLLLEIPGVESLRVPARAWLPATLCLALLAGCGAGRLLRDHTGRARLLIVVLSAAVLVEGWFFDGTMEAPRPMRQGVVPAGALVLDLPLEPGFFNAVPQYRAVLGGYRTINGYSGYEPPHFTPLRRDIADLIPTALHPYRREDLYVIVRPTLEPEVAAWIASHAGVEHLYDLEGARVYRLPRLR